MVVGGIHMKNKRKKSINIPAVMLVTLLLLIFAVTRSWVLTLIILIAFMALATYLKTPAGKGKIGELVVRIVIGRNKPKKDHYSIHNITFHDGTKSVQIDHLVINRKGIHVIETKNYSGRIYGNEFDKQWTQVLAFGRVKYKLHNPIHQNYGHIKGLNAVLNKDDNIYHSYIIFTARAEIMNKYNTPVIYPIKLNKNIKEKADILTKAEVVNIYEEINKIKSNNKITNKEHVKSINERLKMRE